MKILASELATGFGLRVVPFVNRKTGAADPKRVVVKAQKTSAGNLLFGVFRKLSGLTPTKVKQGQTSIIATFTSATFFKAKVEIPTVKLD